MHLLDTASKVIDALGGTAKVAKSTGYSKQSVSNWRHDNHMPHKKFLKMRAALRKQGHIAPPELWGIEDTDE